MKPPSEKGKVNILMPKSKLADMISHRSDNDYITNLVANINYEMFRKKITVKDISKKTGIAEATFRLRMNEPGTFKQSEIVLIAGALKVSPWTLATKQLKYSEVRADA